MNFTKKSKPIEINVAPLIDIVFLLLIFFMLASEFIDYKTIDLVSPIESNQSTENKNIPIIILLSESGEIKINDRNLKINELNKFMKNLINNDTEQKVLINTNTNTKINLLVSVIDIIRDLGIDNVALLTEE